MPKYAQLVMGPAGSGKSTYCSSLVRHCEALRRTVHVVNLDPAAEYFDYPVLADIRELIHLDDAMEDETLHFGPNGGLIFCMEYFAQNLEWLEEQLDDVDDDYVIFDCPGQIELYSHIPVMRQFVEQLQRWDFRVCGVFLIDSQFLVQSSKLVSGILAALSAMVNLEIPHVNVMTKLDLISKKLDLISKKDKKDIERFLEPDLHLLLNEEFEHSTSSKKFQKLNAAMATLVEDYSLVKFMPLDQTDEDSLNDLLLHIDNAIQYGEDLDVKVKDFDEVEAESTSENLTHFE